MYDFNKVYNFACKLKIEIIRLVQLIFSLISNFVNYRINIDRNTITKLGMGWIENSGYPA